MVHRFITLLAFVSAVAMAADTKPLADLQQLKWQHRVLILWAQDVNSTYENVLEQNGAAMDERDLILFVVDDVKLRTNFDGEIESDFGPTLRERFPQEKASFFLVGKDGGLKRYGQAFDARETFAVIDSMPMRMREMDSEQY